MKQESPGAEKTIFSVKKYILLPLLLILLTGWSGTTLSAQKGVVFHCPDEIFFDGDEIEFDVPDCTIFNPGDQITLVALDCNGQSEMEYTLDFTACDELAIPPEVTFTAPEDLPDCFSWEVHFPNRAFGIFTHCGEDEYCNQECYQPCTALNILDAWGGLIDVSFPLDVTIENEPHSMPYIDFGCVEICRMKTRTFYALNCEVPMELQDVTIYNRLRLGDVSIYQDPLLTGMIMCPADITINLPGQRCCLQNGSVIWAEDCDQCIFGFSGSCIDENDTCEPLMIKPNISHQIMSQLEAQAMVTDDCIITIHGIHVGEPIRTPEGAENVPNGAQSAFQLFSPEPMSFPMNITLGEALPFEIKFKPPYSGPHWGSVEICFETSCPCANSDPNPEFTETGSQVEFCEYQRIYIELHGYGAECGEYGPEEACPPKCPEAIAMPSLLKDSFEKYCDGINLFGNSACLTGVTVNNGSKPDANYCGQWCLNLASLQLAVSSQLPNFTILNPGQCLDLVCDGFVCHPGFPFFFFDEENHIFYLVKEDGVQVIDVLLYNEVDEINCSWFEPGDIFTIVQHEEPPADPQPQTAQLNGNGNGSYSTSTYEYVACDGEILYARKVSGELPDVTVDFYAEFSDLGIYGEYSSGALIDGGWGNEGCHSVRTELFVVDEELGPLCNLYQITIVDLPADVSVSCTRAPVQMGCTDIGTPIIRELSLLNCKAPQAAPPPPLPEGQVNGPFAQEFQFTCNDLFDVTVDHGDHHDFGSNCSIVIEDIFFIGKDCMGDPGDVTITDFSLASPQLPLTLNKGDNLTMEIEFDPGEVGEQCSYVVICYENYCPSCQFVNIQPEDLEALGLTEHEFPCNTGKLFVFEIEACAIDFDVTDFDFEFEDPCSCEDPLNILDPETGAVLFFHDVLKITAGENEAWYLTGATGGNLYDEGGIPLVFGAPGVIFDEQMGNMYIWHVWHRANEQVFANFFLDDFNGGPVLLNQPVTVCLDICNPIPTLGQWGIIILGLLMMIFGTVAIKQRSMVTLGSKES